MLEKPESPQESLSDWDIKYLQRQNEMVAELKERLEKEGNEKARRLLEIDIKSIEESMERRRAVVEKSLS